MHVCSSLVSCPPLADRATCIGCLTSTVVRRDHFRIMQVAGGWTNETLHSFLVWLDLQGVRSVDIWCGGAVVGGDGGCSTMSSCNSTLTSSVLVDAESSKSECVHGIEFPCRWFLDQISWWRFNGQ